MNFDRRRFLGGMAGVAGALAAPRVFAAPLCGEAPALLPQAMAALDRNARLIPHRDLIGIVVGPWADWTADEGLYWQRDPGGYVELYCGRNGSRRFAIAALDRDDPGEPERVWRELNGK